MANLFELFERAAVVITVMAQNMDEHIPAIILLLFVKTTYLQQTILSTGLNLLKPNLRSWEFKYLHIPQTETEEK
jgi:hypothetical protein